MDAEPAPHLFRPTEGGYRWDGVAYQPYKQDGSAPFKDISRQTLFHDPTLGCELRYFEMDAAGYSTLERHEHTHAVMILRGHGQCRCGQAIHIRLGCDELLEGLGGIKDLRKEEEGGSY